MIKTPIVKYTLFGKNENTCGSRGDTRVRLNTTSPSTMYKVKAKVMKANECPGSCNLVGVLLHNNNLTVGMGQPASLSLRVYN